MKLIAERKTLLLSRRGARAGEVLCGCGLNNQGLRLQVLEDQARGHEGPIRGRFVLLELGDNVHAEALAPLLNQETDAQEVLAAIRRERPACVSVVNARSLAVEVPDA